MTMRPATSFLFALSLGLAGCGGTGSTTASGDLATDAARGTATWQVLDLATGAVVPSAELPLPANDPAYRDRYLALRRLPAGTVALGSASGAFARQDDEVATRTAFAGAYIGMLELTQAQWRRIAGDASRPWTALGGAEGDALPATGMSWQEAHDALAAWGKARLRLPDPATWEVAARGGGSGAFPWGDGRDASLARTYAVTWDGDRDASGPLPVGGRLANGFGLFDMAGNVWELTSDGAMRGGSWDDALALARCANRAAIDADAGHPSVGLRVVYLP